MSEPEEILLVTVAPYETVTVSPHPSGIPGLPPLTLHGGATLRVPLSRAEQLYNQRKILNVVTGQVKPPDPPSKRIEGPTISYGNSPPIPFSDPARIAGAHMMATREATAKYEAEEEERRVKRNAEREAKPHRWERGPAPRIILDTNNYNPLGPIAGVDYD